MQANNYGAITACYDVYKPAKGKLKNYSNVTVTQMSCSQHVLNQNLVCISCGANFQAMPQMQEAWTVLLDAANKLRQEKKLPSDLYKAVVGDLDEVATLLHLC